MEGRHSTPAEASSAPTSSPARAIFSRYPIRAGRTEEIRSELADALGEANDPERIVGLTDESRQFEPHTISIFLESFAGRSFLVWHVEGSWATTTRTAVIEDSPLFERLEPFLVTDAADAIEPAAYARHPDRPRAVPRHTDGVPFVLGTDDGTLDRPDVVLFRTKIRSGLPRWVLGGFQWLMDRLDDEGRIERWFDERTEPILDEECVYTETVFLQSLEGDYYYLNYLECESRERVYEAYHESENAIARVSEPIARWSLEDSSFLDAVPETPFELLVHAVSERRP